MSAGFSQIDLQLREGMYYFLKGRAYTAWSINEVLARKVIILRGLLSSLEDYFFDIAV